jgi:hypothetical protein
MRGWGRGHIGAGLPGLPWAARQRRPGQADPPLRASWRGVAHLRIACRPVAMPRGPGQEGSRGGDPPVSPLHVAMRKPCACEAGNTARRQGTADGGERTRRDAGPRRQEGVVAAS